MPGRPRKPTKILQIQGTARKDRHSNRSDLVISGEIPEPPVWLTGEAREEWDRLIGHSQYRQVLATIDRGALAIYCDLWGRYVGGTVSGGPMSATMITVLVNLGSKLGLNPSDRAKVRLPEAEKSKSKWANLRTTSNAG